MKLIDILARDLKVWPEACESITQEDDGSLSANAQMSDIYNEWAFGKPLACLGKLELSEDFREELVTHEEWQAVVDALNAEKCDHSHCNDQGCPECGEEFAPAWNGEGLPPVGTVCQWHPNQDGWVQIEILGHSGEETWFRRDGHTGSEVCLRMAFFRPIRTAEQIKDAEREEAINELASSIGRGTFIQDATHIYDELGYRKQVVQ